MHGFAILNMTSEQLGQVALKDPFMRYFTQAYVGMTRTSNKLLETYLGITDGQEFNDTSDYLGLSKFFQSTLEPVVGVNIRFVFVMSNRYDSVSKGRDSNGPGN